jgi:hypothetical protein
MPNAIKYKSGSLAGSISTGNVALGVNESVLGPTETTGWYSGLTPSPSQYVIYEVNSGSVPKIYQPSDDTQLTQFARSNGATGANTGSVASVLNWATSQNNIMIVNKAYPSIVTDQISFLLDANFTPSYPYTESTLYSVATEPLANTINPVSVGASRYNNPGFAGGIFIDPQTYSGSTVWRTDFIPQSASFIPRLGSTEGFGFFHGMGTSLTASNFYISSIYVSSSYPLQVSSTEGYSNTYSNISGWGTNSTTTTRVNVGGGWTRLYTLWFQNVNGFASRATTAAATHTVNTTSTTTLIVSRSIAQSNLSDSTLLWGVVSHSPNIGSNGGLTGLSILNHGLDTGSWTKASFPNNPILSGSGFPYLYYIQLSVPSSGGSNTNITLNYNPTGYYYALTDNKFWKITFNTSSLQVGQTASVYWAAPMIEPVYANFPSQYVLRTGSIVSNGSLINGTTWSQNGWFEFDGVDDYINISNDTNLTNPLTICALVNTNVVTSSAQVIYGPNANGQDNWLSITDNKALLHTTQTADVNNVNLTGTTFISASRWHHIVGIVNNTTASLWVNGRNDANLSARSYIIGSWNSSARVGQRATGQFPFNGKIAQVISYGKQLTQTEILQNYYQAPIVTDGLVFAVDAGNLVSYESGSTTGYSLTLSGSLTSPVSCSLVNGVQYNPQFQGYFDFDGTDDRILLENTSTQTTGIRLGSGTTPWMVNSWIRTAAAGSNSLGSFPVISNRSGGPVYSNMGIGAGGVMKYQHYSGSWITETGSVAVNNNQWHMLSWVNLNNNTLDMYVDGIFDQNVSSSIVGGGNINPVDIIGSSFGGYLDADIAFLSINIRSTLYTQNDVSQNFNAQRSRFGI